MPLPAGLTKERSAEIERAWWRAELKPIAWVFARGAEPGAPGGGRPALSESAFRRRLEAWTPEKAQTNPGDLGRRLPLNAAAREMRYAR